MAHSKVLLIIAGIWVLLPAILILLYLVFDQSKQIQKSRLQLKAHDIIHAKHRVVINNKNRKLSHIKNVLEKLKK